MHDNWEDALMELQAERDRYREALEKIASLPLSVSSGDLNFARMLAGNALDSVDGTDND
jgi:hypothetical protein